MLQKIDNYFGITKLGSSFRIEILAGVSTFLALSYIFVVNPAILSEAGISTSVSFFATIFGSVVATLLMGLWARLPLALAPGLEMNSYIAFVVVGTLGFTWQGALGAVFWVGVLALIFAFTPVRAGVIKAIPDKLKSGLAAAVGIFLVLIALRVSEILTYQEIQLTGVGELFSENAQIFLVGLIIVVALRYFKVRGATILSIVGASIFAHIIGVGNQIEPITYSSEMFAGVFAFDWRVIFDPKIWTVILVLFILDFYGPIAKFTGLTRNTSIVDEKGEMPRMKEALAVDGASTIIGAAAGTTNLITYVESAVGIGEGGRTGLTAVVVAILMSLFLFLVPIVNLVPVVATTGVVFFAGLTLLPSKKDLKSYTWIDIVAVVLMVITTIATFSLNAAMFAGFAAFLVFSLFSGNRTGLNWYMIISTLLLLLGIIFS